MPNRRAASQWLAPGAGGSAPRTVSGEFGRRRRAGYGVRRAGDEDSVEGEGARGADEIVDAQIEQGRGPGASRRRPARSRAREPP